MLSALFSFCMVNFPALYHEMQNADKSTFKFIDRATLYKNAGFKHKFYRNEENKVTVVRWQLGSSQQLCFDQVLGGILISCIKILHKH